MAVTNWIGGTTAVTQVATGTVGGTWANGNTIRTVLVDEGGTSQTVTSTATGSDKETQVRDVHLTELQASNQSMFKQATWTESGTLAIVATAKIAGRPLSGGTLANVVVGSVPAGSGTFSYADTTANAGPHDLNTDANWVLANGSAANSPTAGDTVSILSHPTDEDAAGNPISYDMLYGLDHNTVAISDLRIPKAYRGIIGDPINKFFWKIDVTSGTAITIIDSNSPSIWIKGSHDAINIAGLPRGVDALHLDGGTITVLRMLGGRVLGDITIDNGTVITAIESLGASMNVKIGTTGTRVTSMIIDGGTWELDQGINGTIELMGGTVTVLQGAITTINNRGGLIFPNGSGTITTLNNYRGTTNFERNTKSSITVSNALIWGGFILDKSGLANVVYSANVIVYGGSVSSDTATTQSQSA